MRHESEIFEELKRTKDYLSHWNSEDVNNYLLGVQIALLWALQLNASLITDDDFPSPTYQTRLGGPRYDDKFSP